MKYDLEHHPHFCLLKMFNKHNRYKKNVNNLAISFNVPPKPFMNASFTNSTPPNFI